MEISVERFGEGKEVVAVRVVGAVDSDTVDRFSRTVRELLEEGNFRLLMDLEGLTYINTAGLSVIADAFKKAHQNGGSLKLVRVKPEIRELLDVVRFTRIIDIFDDMGEALRSFGVGQEG
ncbi:MAG: STAS domain-containing protein [Candidatus Geothermincolales bacterium]